MNPDDVNRILSSLAVRPVPPKPDQAAFLRAAEHFDFQPPYLAVRRLSR